MSRTARSWRRSREAALWHSLDPGKAGRVMTIVYGADAGAEALLRAFLGERDCDREAARFWIAVYDRLASLGTHDGLQQGDGGGRLARRSRPARPRT